MDFSYYFKEAPITKYTVDVTSDINGKCKYKIGSGEYSELDNSPHRLQVPAGETVTVLAEGDSGYKFVRWAYKGGVTEDNPYSMIINENMVLRCIFERIPIDKVSNLQ